MLNPDDFTPLLKRWHEASCTNSGLSGTCNIHCRVVVCVAYRSRNSSVAEPPSSVWYNSSKMDEGALPSQTEFQREAELIRAQSGYLAMLNYLFDLCIRKIYSQGRFWWAHFLVLIVCTPHRNGWHWTLSSNHFQILGSTKNSNLQLTGQSPKSFNPSNQENKHLCLLLLRQAF